MYSREESSQLRQAFWTAFGKYISPQLSADGLRVNWVNYKTGIKYLQFKMQAEGRSAFIGIIYSNPDAGIRELFYEQMLQLKNIFQAELGEEWEWQAERWDMYGKASVTIGTQLHNVSVFRQEDWPALISFFKPRIIALDAFWSMAQYSFELFK